MFFPLKGYTHIFAPKRKFAANFNEKVRLKNMLDTYCNLLRESWNGTLDTEYGSVA